MPLFMFLLWTLSVSLLCLSWVPPPLLVPLYLYPLLFRPLFALLRHIRGRRCLLRYRRGRYHLEFDGSALTGHLTRDELRLFKQELSRCTRHAMRQRKTLLIESHLLTDWRQKELRRALPHDSLIRYSLHPTPLSAVMVIRLLTLLSEWRWASISPRSGRLIIVPGRENHAR